MGAISLKLRVNMNGLAAKLARWDGIAAKGDAVVERVAMDSFTRVHDATPVRYYGSAAAGWVVRNIGMMARLVTNPLPLMGWLERGTKAHGPKTARALFIPLNQKTAEAGPREVMRANAQAHASGQWRNYGTRASGGSPRPVTPAYVLGVDFLWAKRVRGIKALHIARDDQKVVNRELKTKLKAMLVSELR